MNRLFIILILFPLSILAQNIINIETVDQLENINFQNNTTYLLKTDEVFNLIKPINIRNNINITLGCYGEGKPPIIKQTGLFDVIMVRSSQKVIIENLVLEGNGKHCGIHIAGHYLKDAQHTTNITIKNCEISNGFNGIRSLPYATKCDTINILNCNIHQIFDDGIFIKHCNEVTIDSCFIWHVNLNWNKGEKNSGDCIHLLGDCNNWSVKYNTLDRRLTSNKFCFIYGSKTYEAMSGELIGNTFYPPKDTVGGVGNCLYISKSKYVKIEGNKFLGKGYQWGGKPGAIGYFAARKVIFENNYIENLTRANFTSMGDSIYIKGNELIDCFDNLFWIYNFCKATNNIFYNFNGNAFFEPNQANATIVENNNLFRLGKSDKYLPRSNERSR